VPLFGLKGNGTIMKLKLNLKTHLDTLISLNGGLLPAGTLKIDETIRSPADAYKVPYFMKMDLKINNSPTRKVTVNGEENTKYHMTRTVIMLKDKSEYVQLLKDIAKYLTHKQWRRELTKEKDLLMVFVSKKHPYLTCILHPPVFAQGGVRLTMEVVGVQKFKTVVKGPVKITEDLVEDILENAPPALKEAAIYNDYLKQQKKDEIVDEGPIKQSTLKITQEPAHQITEDGDLVEIIPKGSKILQQFDIEQELMPKRNMVIDLKEKRKQRLTQELQNLEASLKSVTEIVQPKTNAVTPVLPENFKELSFEDQLNALIS